MAIWDLQCQNTGLPLGHITYTNNNECVLHVHEYMIAFMA